jgi:phage replication-related protein YjqB (UPF0714/DUF867 family)
MADKYRSFAQLSVHEEEGIDFRVSRSPRSIPVVVIAPHGGGIEPGTSQIAGAIAGSRFSAYCFEGTKAKGNSDLHLTSTRFDEPRGREAVAHSDVTLAVHGRRDGEDRNAVWVGGRDVLLRDRIVKAIKRAGFKASSDSESEVSGSDPRNICNRNRRGMGVQLEIPRTLRRRLTKNRTTLRAFAIAVRNAIHKRPERGVRSVAL